jgi:hypothetical protein
MEEGRTLAIIDWSELIMADILLTRLDAFESVAVGKKTIRLSTANRSGF